MSFETDPERIHNAILAQQDEIMEMLLSQREGRLNDASSVTSSTVSATADLLGEVVIGGDDGSVSPLSDEDFDTTVVEVVGVKEKEEDVGPRPSLARQAKVDDADSTPTGGEAGVASTAEGKDEEVSPTLAESGKSKAYKARCGYRKACSTLRKFMGCDPASLSIKDRHMLANQRARVRSYEKSYPDSVRPGDGACDILLVGVAKQPETPAAKACNKAAEVATGVEGKKIIVGSNPRSTTQKVVGKPSSIVKDHGLKVAKPEPRKSGTMEGASVAQRPMASKPDARKVTRGTEGFKVPGPSVFASKAQGTYAEVSRGKGRQPPMEDGPSTSKAVGGKNQSGPIGSARSVSAPKRTRSGEGPLMGSKKPRKQESIGVDPSLRVAVIDRSDPDGQISPANWVRLEGELMLQMAADDREEGEVQFCGIDWLKGVKVIDCVNKESVRFLKNAIDGVGEFWPGAKLEVVARSLIPLRPIVYVRLLPPILAPEVVLKLLKKQNKGLNTQVWSVLSTIPCESSSAVEMKIAVDGAALEMLQASEGRLRMGFGTVKFRHPSIKERQ
ncbi:hypothetical protein F5148DRAFT_1296768 [Russula earlei]|uniref:Uncharacterized protein n=1 Tax=Russula earlei TaxID=71964 RepID=A0ACC0TQQ1_9AGAM|nr:hypothetical protein F5148DRAFT_1296768 [Russula earlei]